MSALPRAQGAPRGKAYRVARLSQVSGDVKLLLSHEIATLEDAERAQRAIDWRLAPTVVMVDKGK